jgi:hypothetical protein
MHRARPDADPTSGQGNRGPGRASRHALGPAGRTQTVPPDPTAGAYRGYAMRLRLAVPACLVGWSEPSNQAKGGDSW